MRCIKLRALILSAALSGPTMALAEVPVPIECPSDSVHAVSGNYTGYIISTFAGIAYDQNYVHFLIKDVSDNRLECVKQNSSNRNVVATAIKAMVLHEKVTIEKNNQQWITKIST
ncbi:hypothetical protein N5W20_03685 [Candidatus Kirkpatrickella diaphorinae]|uniref:Uncharacterized protein n=1 Tax=Candidatus Kirkpatrickella diaphorinae TaxID=2984322 RepID=A0ABY6GM61_9PROT|nr:hypothetical protein [Candidatus Kirkpatrickella diaphorinae]UYH51968.1 hypothetical protein N5W20_03685 [Candidatus Kirkpatrickella diaphorinae]